MQGSRDERKQESTFLRMAVLPFVSGKCQLFQGMQKNNLATVVQLTSKATSFQDRH